MGPLCQARAPSPFSAILLASDRARPATAPTSSQSAGPERGARHSFDSYASVMPGIPSS